MAKEKISPPIKSINASGGIKDGKTSTTTTPMKSTRKFWGSGKDSKNKIM